MDVSTSLPLGGIAIEIRFEIMDLFIKTVCNSYWKELNHQGYVQEFCSLAFLASIG